MPLFSLTPVADALEMPAWNASTHRGPCYVVAPDARRARLHAASRFANPAAARTASGLLPASPWTLSALVAVDLAFRLVDAMAPEGTIMVPDDSAGQPDAFRVLAPG